MINKRWSIHIVCRVYQQPKTWCHTHISFYYYNTRNFKLTHFFNLPIAKDIKFFRTFSKKSVHYTEIFPIYLLKMIKLEFSKKKFIYAYAAVTIKKQWFHGLVIDDWCHSRSCPERLNIASVVRDVYSIEWFSSDYTEWNLACYYMLYAIWNQGITSSNNVLEAFSTANQSRNSTAF